MEIGAEISKKIRAAIKSKLQELGAYIDEELPDYIMVMVANKKTAHQMADDLSLFLGNNTIKFTAWLHGVLEKLRSVAVEPAPGKNLSQTDISMPPSRSSSSAAGHDDGAESSRALAVSSSRSDRMEARVSSSAHESRRGGPSEKSSSRLTSTVKPLMEPFPTEAIIDIKPDLDDDLIAEDPLDGRNSGRRVRGTFSRPTAQIYRPGPARTSSSEGSSRLHESRSSRTSRSSSSREELSRKRKAPVASSVVRVNQTEEDSDDVEEEEDDDEDEGYGGRSLSSRVSLPSKPERRPTLPPAKQANRNLILKAISEAQDSITRTTAYPTIPQRQMVPVAPRTRLASNEEMTAAIQLVQEHLHSLHPRAPVHSEGEIPPSRTQAPTRSVSTRAQSNLAGSVPEREQCDEDADAPAADETKAFDTRSFIMSRPALDEAAAGQQQQQQHQQRRTPTKEEALSAVPRTVQASKEKGDGTHSASPKFIVTLDGVPSPLSNVRDCDMELDDVRPPARVAEGNIHVNPRAKLSVLQRLQGIVVPSEAVMMDMEGEVEEEEEEENGIPFKKQKALERCKFWPVCKSGDECLYHHPTTQCKTFPNCKFGDKCLFVHPNCKYDARCTKPDCPFTHVSRRGAVVAAPRPAPPTHSSSNVCRFFPECKKVDCAFYHPKPCRFAAQCKRAGCTFYHPNTSVPPRHALKWTKAQSS